MSAPRLTGNRCRCPTCGATFSTPRNFDAHRKGEWSARSCANPATVGLVADSLGVWKLPAPTGVVLRGDSASGATLTEGAV